MFPSRATGRTAGLPNARDRRKNRETDLVREITASYSIEPEAIEKVVLGDGKLPEDYKCQVKVDACAKAASAAFDFEFRRELCVRAAGLPGFQNQRRVVHRRRPRAERLREDDGPPRAPSRDVEEGKVATREPDWDLNATVAKLFRDKFGEDDARRRDWTPRPSTTTRSSRIDERAVRPRALPDRLAAGARMCVLDEFTSLVWKSNSESGVTLATRLLTGWSARRSARPSSSAARRRRASTALRRGHDLQRRRLRDGARTSSPT